MKALLLTLLGWGVVCSAFAQDINLRHDLGGQALDALATLVLRFNDSQKGKGRVVLQDVHGLENRQALPHLALLDPDDSLEFFGTRPRFRPLHEVMGEAGQKLDAARFYPQVADAVDDASGRVQALPLALSLPVLLTNRTALRKAGLDPDRSAKTWWELQKVAGALLDHGSKCPLTTTRFAWVHAENVLTQAGETVVGQLEKVDRVRINSMINVKHLALLASWQKSQYFHYFGPGREANRRFLTGECAMLTGESSLYADAVRAGIDVGMGPLPYYSDVYSPRPTEVLLDGAGLWVLAGYTRSDYALIAGFMTFLLRPEVQKEWVRATGNLPMTPAAIAALRDSGIPKQMLAVAQKRLAAPRKGSVRARHGPIRDRLHEFLGEEVTLVWTAGRSAKEALDSTATRVNGVIAPPVSESGQEETGGADGT